MACFTLAELLTDPDGHHLVALQPCAQGPETVRYELRHFQVLVAALVYRLESEPRFVAVRSVMLYSRDTYFFAAALCALALLRKTIVLPQNAAPGTLREQGSCVELFIGDREFCVNLSQEAVPFRVLPLQDVVAEPEQCYLERLREKARSQVTMESVEIVVFTSGSTGKPKAIHKQWGNFLAEVEVIESLWGKLPGETVILSSVSHQHVYGLLFRCLWPLLSKRAFFSDQVLYPEALVTQASVVKHAVFIASPAFLSRVGAHLEGRELLLQLKSKLKRVFSSGGPLAAQDNFAIQRLFAAPVTEVFGSSETGGVGYRQRDPQNPSLTWQSMPGVALKKDQKSGCLMVRSPFVVGCDWFLMGDQVTLLEQGGFALAGRADRIVKIEEKRVCLDEIESRLETHVLIAQARVLVLPGKRAIVAAVLVLSQNGEAVLAEHGKLALTRQLRQDLADYIEAVALPRKWRIVSALPVNAQGKVLHGTLAALFATSATGSECG